jgi:sugar phosphate isomerase/epimerase
MKILYGKSMWGMEPAILDVFLAHVKESGFDVSEINPRYSEVPGQQSVALHKHYGLQCVCYLGLEGTTPAQHLEFLERWFPIALTYQPLHINFHAGRDIFSFEDNLAIFRRIAELSRQHFIDVTHETHRGRPLFSTFAARRYLEVMPELFLNADFSHWMVVHESDLRDQPEAMELAIQRSRYIHARVGYEQGPQITDPAAPEWQGHVENHLGLWRRIVDANRQAGRDYLVITPEFGPPAYMHTLPYTRQPVADTWQVNTAMLQILKQRFGTEV